MMGVFDLFKKEKRATTYPNGSIPISDPRIAEVFGNIWGNESTSGINVNIENALGVPAIWAAVNFLSGTLAGLPLNVYKRTKEGRERVKNGVAPILHDVINDEMSSFEWRKHLFDGVFTGGRGFTYIERNASGVIVNLWPLDPAQMNVKKVGFIKKYEYQNGSSKVTYAANEIIDIPFMLKSDGFSHRGPIASNKDIIGLAIAATNYGSKFFQNGGVPPFVINGGFQSTAAMQRASEDFDAGIKKASKESRLALVLPNGLEAKTIGSDVDKAQLVELQRFSVEQIARVYSIPPTFLQDLTHGTFSNTEQQDLHVTKHTIRRWVEQTEQEINLKIFGRKSNRLFAEFNLDGLLRGDFKTRMDGYATGVQNGILKPNEARRKENLPDEDDGDKLMIQGATVPISNQLQLPLAQEQNNDN